MTPFPSRTSNGKEERETDLSYHVCSLISFSLAGFKRVADAHLGNGRAQMATIRGIVPVSMNVSGILRFTILKIVDMYRVLTM